MKKTIDIVVVLDRSGSMESIKFETINGFNKFIKAQQKTEVDAHITLVQFDQEYEVVYKRLPLNEVPKLNRNTFVPRSVTALLDAIGKTIKSTRAYQKADSDVKYQTIFVIITDGQENASIDYSRDQIFKKISKMQKKHEWEFVFLAANQDAIATAHQFGISSKKAIRFSADKAGTKAVFECISKEMSHALLSKKPIAFTNEDRKKQGR